MDIQQIKTFVEKNPSLVQMKQSVRYPDYFVLKYKNNVFYDDLWTPELMYCRGLVVNADWEVISRPFNKIYNYGIEKNAPEFDKNSLVRATRKVNGFMLAITWDKITKQPLISTTGSLDSVFVELGREALSSYGNAHTTEFLDSLKQHSEFTHLFECVHPKDPHIIEEPVNGLYYLGSMKKDLEENDLYSCHEVELLFTRPETYILRFGDVLELTKSAVHEGFCIYGFDKSGNSSATKIKSPYYLINKFFARKQSITDIVSDKAKNIFDEEYYPLIENIRENKEHFNSLTEQERLSYIREFLGA